MGGMFGGGGGGGKSRNSGPDPMIAMMEAQARAAAEQARAAEEARKKAMAEQQQQSASAAAQQGEMAAKQQLSQAGISQQAADRAALQSMQQAQSTAGYQATAGGGQQVGQTQKAAAMGIGGAGAIGTPSVMPGAVMAANLEAGGTGRPANVFKLPSASGSVLYSLTNSLIILATSSIIAMFSFNSLSSDVSTSRACSHASSSAFSVSIKIT